MTLSHDEIRAIAHALADELAIAQAARERHPVPTHQRRLDRRLKVAELHHSGHSIRQIAEALDICQSTVMNDLNTLKKTKNEQTTKY